MKPYTVHVERGTLYLAADTARTTADTASRLSTCLF